MRAPNTVQIVGIALATLLMAVAGGAGATDARQPLPPCATRPADLKELVRQLANPQAPGRMGLGGRLRCTVQLQPKLAATLLLPLVGGPDRTASLMATKALAELGPDAVIAVPQLVRMLRSQDENTRVIAAQTLAAIGPGAEPAVGALAAALQDESPTQRKAAARALAHIGRGAGPATPALATQLTDPNPQVRATAG
jgi:hypothetical protein